MAKRRSAPPDSAAIDDGNRSLPHSLDAERAVLGSILLDNRRVDDMLDVMQPADCFRRSHQLVADAMVRLDARHEAIDPLTLREELSRAGVLDDVGGPAYLASLVDGVPRAVNTAHYARIVREKAIGRAIIVAANRAMSSAYEGDQDVDAQLTTLETAVAEIRAGALHGRCVSLVDDAPELEADLSRRIANRGVLTGVPTGLRDLDGITNGWQPGDMIVLAARPSIGKTAAALQMATVAGGHGYHVAIFEMEMRRRQLGYRMLSQLSGVPLSRLTRGLVQGTDIGQAADAFDRMKLLPIAIDDTARRTVSDIRARCRLLRRQQGRLDLVIIDYVQLMASELPSQRGANRTQEVTDISRRLKILADELTCPVIVLSQLSRKSTDRTDPRPRMSDLRESGALEQDADVVVLLHRAKHKESGPTEFIVDKNRNDMTGEFFADFARENQRFSDRDAPPPAPEPVSPDERKESKRRYFQKRHGG